MIKLTPDPTFECEVRLTVPGRAEPAVVPMTLAYMPAEQRAAWFTEVADTPARQAIVGIVKGWKAEAVQGADGQPTPFSDAALAQLISNYDAAAGEILAAWSKALAESRAKN